ncbi:hypothetical protein RM572_10205 [Streptomyces sp. DSM 42041]|uniref:Uncharacterized protein n=1 Tax=Streptomyces hazeniae TaxID=3075538 RepID=A0ABU2NQ70_9ACTN|nr:hypothetical protein [Streptomyces sp. DSM 42041]MDT0379136.1 hypothetical protein [Streptomyces sp. DSM 42041]
MAHTAGRTASRVQGRLAAATSAFGARPGGRRHPVAAAVMVLPMALLLAVVFGGVEAVVTQASSVAGILGR